MRVLPPPADAQVPTGDYGWRFRAANGQISAVGGEGFTRRLDAYRAVEDFCAALDAAYKRSGDTIPPILDVDE